ncbi:MAG: hypothetical protein ACRDOK_00350 [Streptosporangiaceae bacterium]
MAQQGSPPGRVTRRAGDDQHGRGGAVRARRAGRAVASQRPGWQDDAFGPDDTDPDLPAWAGPNAYPVRTAGARRRPDPHADEYVAEAERDETDDGGANSATAEPAAARQGPRRQGRAAATRLRKSRRRVYRWCAVAVAVCVIGAVIAVLATSSSPKPQLYVTALQPGEFTSVPSACTSVSASVLTQYLTGSRRTTNQFSGLTQSQCSFTVDAKPVFRLLEVTTDAYQPFAAASGDGSASANARDNLALTRATLADPGKKSPLSRAQITPLAKLGQQAFAGYQRATAGNIVSDVVTVVVLERNVLITVELSAQQSPGFSPTPVATLQAGATAAASDVLAKVLTQPTA